MARNSLTLVILLISSPLLGVAEPSPKKAIAVRTLSPPVIDGLVDDPQWATAPPLLDFTQFDPVEGVLPTELTSVRLLYDNSALYVGVICYDAHPEQIVRQLTRRDRSSEADRFSVMIDSYFDRQTAFVFVTNVSGVQSDGVLSQDGALYDLSWDAVWTVRTRVYRDGWSAEFEIPYNAIRFAEQARGVYTWGINFRRYISRKKETDEWVMVPRREMLQISRWGTVEGIKDITPPLHLELLPYLSGTASYQTAYPGRPWNSSYSWQGGVDLKYGIERNFTVDATINPDFGQVEVDQSVLNLTVFETRFPEKRPFFVEGAQLFTFGSAVDNTPLSVFFSRRVGKRPSGSPFVVEPPGGSIEENPQVTTIFGAVKLSGRSHSGFSMGLLSAATDEEKAVLVDSAGARTGTVTEPRASYNVVRLKQDFDGGSWLGAIGTLASRRTMNPAFAGGLDWNIRLDGGTYTIDGYGAAAHSSTERVLRDGSSGRDGGAGRVLFSRIAAEHWLYTGSFDFYTRYFNLNDLGFFAQPHDYGGYTQLLYRENFGTGLFRRYAISAVPEARWNWDGVLTNALSDLSFTGEFMNFWRLVLVYDLAFRAYDDEERGIIGLYRRPLSHTFRTQVKTDERRNISATLTLSYAFDERRKQSWSGSLGLTIRPVSWIELSPSLLWTQTRGEEAWAFPAGNVFDPAVSATPFSVFGDRDLDQVDVELRGIVTFSRTLSLQFFSQILLARGTYLDYRRFDGPRAIPYDFASSAGYISPNFNEAVFNANVLLRWEYLPGSTLYLVWTQGRFGDSGNPATGFERRLRDTFALPHDDALLLKISYWFPL
ncbi:MAG: DUF5916 domain-containing protein [Bacteroidota bacterium]